MSNIKRIIVFGANGQTGIKILKRAIKEGLEVTAYVRTPSKIPEDLRDKLHKTVQGDVFDKENVENAIKGNEAVLSTIGAAQPFGHTTVMSQGCTNIISGMKKHGVKKLMIVSTAMYMETEYGIFARIVTSLVKSTQDHKRQLEVLAQSSDDIDWIAVMPPFIKNRDDVNPNYKYEKDILPGVAQVTTAEIADFMISSLEDETRFEKFNHSQVGISSKAKEPSYSCTVKMTLFVLAVGILIYYSR